MDKILRGYLRDFAESHNLEHLRETELFERFAVHCLVSRTYPEPFALEETIVAGGNDTGLDGIAVVVNGRVVTSLQELEYYRKTRSRMMDVAFLFIQAKTSDHIDNGEVSTFLNGVHNFFSDQAILPENTSVQDARRIKDAIYNLAPLFSGNNPVCQMFFVTTGQWAEPAPILATVRMGLDRLKQSRLLRNVEFEVVDADKLQNIYSGLSRRFQRTINFPWHTILPQIDDAIPQAYIGVLGAREFLKLICTEDGRIQRSIFYDNIRDYQGQYNTINREIAASIQHRAQQRRLPVLNNGVTIVARDVNQTGNRFTLSDYQIVNGCQTSHVLFENGKCLIDDTYLPVKIIQSDDPEITDLITRATNSQTPISREQLMMLRPFQKKLEAFYNSSIHPPDGRLYYERRSGQYNSETKHYQIVTVEAQLRICMAVLWEQPHVSFNHRRDLFAHNHERVFIENHNPYPYYASALTMHYVERLGRERLIPPVYRAFRYHLALLLRVLGVSGCLPRSDARRKMDDYCDRWVGMLRDSEVLRIRSSEATAVLEKVLREYRVPIQDAVKQGRFTELLIAAARKPQG